MAIEKVIDIKIQGNADEAVGSLRSQLRAAQADVAALSEKFGVTSQEAIQAAKRAGELKDQIGDAKALTDAFNPDAKFKALSSSLAGVAGGFAAVQGGMALFGAQSEDVEKTLLKVQSAMALSQGLQAIGESVDSFKQLGAVVQSTTAFKKLDTLATAAATVVQRLFSSAVTTTAVSFNALKTAIVSTGIGALVVGLGYLVAKMNESSDATEEMTERQKDLNKQLEYGKELADANAKGIDFATQIELADAKKRGASDKELTQIKIDGVNARLKANSDEINSIASTQKEGYNLTKEQNKRIQELRAENLDLERKGRLEIANFNADQAAKERDAENKSAEEKKADRRQRQKEAKEQAKKDAEELKAALKAQSDATAANELEITKAIGDAQDKNAEAFMTRSEIEEREVNDKYFRLIELAKQQGKDTLDLEIAQANEINDIRVKSDAEDLKIKQDNAAATEEIEKDNAAATEEIEKEKQQARQQWLAAGANTLKQAASLLGESTDAGKAAAIAAATIETYQAAVSSYNSLSGIPIVGPALGAVAAGVAVASGIANVKKILAVKTPKGGGGGAAPSVAGAGGGAAGGAAPQFNVVGNSGVNQLAGIMATNEQTPVKAYVVPSDVTTGQSLDRNIIRNASLG
jgi:hypothetical protein